MKMVHPVIVYFIVMGYLLIIQPQVFFALAIGNNGFVERKLLGTPKDLITETEMETSDGMVDENQKENQIWSKRKL